jgi:protein disulfide-isomerase
MFCRIFLSILAFFVILPLHNHSLGAIEQNAFDLDPSHAWTSDYDKALQLSQATGKSLLLAFVGSDWCPWSRKLIKEIIEKREFVKELQQDVLFVWVDFPEKSAVAQGQRTQNQGLKNRFAVQELPTLVLVDSSGDEVVKLGYLPSTAQEMAHQLKNFLHDFKQLKKIIGSPRLASLKGEELEKLYKKASQLGRETEKKSLLEIGLKNDQDGFFLIQEYTALIEKAKLRDPKVQRLRRQIMSKDPSNNKGVHLQLALTEFHVLSKNLKKKENPEKAITPLVEYLRVYGPKDYENNWRIEMMIAQFLYSKNHLEKAICHAKMSYETAPSEYKPEVAQSLEYLASKMQSLN